MEVASLKSASNGHTGSYTAPELAHVTSNIVPLSTVLRFHTQEAYKQLSRQIESLAHTKTTESDATRKRKLLTVIVSLRQDFVKLYTLVKWAQRSKDVSRLIDLLQWLRTQEFYFENLALGLNELNHFSGAKLPEADLRTSMEVLVKGRPQLSSYNYLEKPPISPERVLQVLRDLNLALTARMALTSDMPARFRHNYVVRDGRIVFTLKNEFRCSVTVANDLIVDSDAEYTQSPFFFIDFAFLFGVGPDNALTTHRHSSIATELPQSAKNRLEKTVNQVLLQSSLSGLYDVLHKYASAFKLYLISRQLRGLALNSKWRGHIQFRNSAFLVVANYWSSHHLSRNWRSFIEIGVDRSYNLSLRWFKNGRYQHDHGISLAGDEDGEEETGSEPHSLNIDSVLSHIINKHSEILINKVHDSYSASISASDSDQVSFLGPHQLLVKLTPRKSTIFAINPLTGHFYFVNPSPIETATQTKINARPTVLRNKNFVSESDMVANVVTNLVQLRTESLGQTLKTRLVTMGWVANDNVSLSEYESAKLRNFSVAEKGSNPKKTSFFRSRTWPSTWFLVSMVTGSTSDVFWWVARLKSMKGEWVVQWMQELSSMTNLEMNHGFFQALARASSNCIIHHLIVEELEEKGVNFLKLSDENVLTKFGLILPPTTSASRTVMALLNTGSLLPVSVASSTLFLACSFSAESKNELHITLFGLLKDISKSHASSFEQFGVVVDATKGQFFIESTVDLAHRLNNDDTPTNTPLMLASVFGILSKMSSLIGILQHVQNTSLTVTSKSCNELSFEVDPYFQPFLLQVHSDDNSSFSVMTGPGEKRNVDVLVRLLNRELGQSGNALVGSFQFLRESVSVFKTIDSVDREMKNASGFTLQNGLRKLHFEPKFISLSVIQFVFGLNSTSPVSPKKIQRDKIVFLVSFQRDRFAKAPKLLLKLSMKDNFNSHNVKFKKLFESIFSVSNELQKQAVARSETFMKLYYDFVIESTMLEPLMVGITRAFVEFLKIPREV